MAAPPSSPADTSTPTKHVDDGCSLDVPLLRGCGEEDHRRRKLLASDGCPSEGGTTFVRTCLNGLNALSGVGILSVPYALSQGGWLSLLVLLAVAVICCYTGLLLQRCMDAGPHINTYPDIGELAFGFKGRIVVSIFMYLELYLVAIEFLILEGDNLDNLFPNTSLEFGVVKIEGKQLFVLLTALAILPTTWLRNLSVLAFVSAGGVLASIIVVLSVVYIGAFDTVDFHSKRRFFDLGGLPTAMGLFSFCYCGHAVFPTIRTSMKNKSQFSKVLLICFFLCTLNYGSMSMFGYLMYGDAVKSQVTLNLPKKNIASKIAIYTTLINPLTKFALMVTPVANAIEGRFLMDNKRSASMMTRTLLVGSTVSVALTVPFFAYLMALIGSFLSVIASMLLPCLCYLKIFESSRRFGSELVTIAVIMVLGVLIAIFGTYSSLRQIMQSL